MTNILPKNWKDFADTAKANLNFAQPNKVGTAFRYGGVAVGAGLAGDALLRGKTQDGEDRGALGRIGEFLLGGGIAAGSAFVGGRA